MLFKKKKKKNQSSYWLVGWLHCGVTPTFRFDLFSKCVVTKKTEQ